MAMFRRGFHIEDRIISALESCGCAIERDHNLDHEHKLDFVLVRFPQNPKYFSLGVQVTSRLNEIDKMRHFVEINRSTPVAAKALYLEIAEKVNIERGGTPAVLAILMSFQFDSKYAGDTISMATLHDDLSYTIRPAAEVLAAAAPVAFVPAVNVGPSGLFRIPGPPAMPALKPSAVSPAAAVEAVKKAWDERPIADLKAPERMNGVITAYKRQGGYGFIKTDDGQVLWAHLNHVLDASLREQLQNTPYNALNDSLYIPVTFVKGSKANPDARYEQALQIRPRS